MRTIWSRRRPVYNAAMLFLRMRGDYEIVTPRPCFVRADTR
jgi:hypothetical protein